jgi:hypothetical protein
MACEEILFLWTSGLFPFFEYSATAVKVRYEPSPLSLLPTILPLAHINKYL